jgi:uncharacterized membrane protein YecN with MAPEG domain
LVTAISFANSNGSFPMNATIALTTALYAAILGLLGAALTVNVIRNRVRSRVNTGDGGDARLAQAIRAHANFGEQAPIALIVIAFAEALGQRVVIVHVLGVALVVARLASAYALNGSLGPSPLRQMGAGLNLLVLIAASVAILLAMAGLH